MATRAYLVHEDGDRMRVDIREGCGLYSKGERVWQSEPFTPADDGADHLFGAQPGQPFTDADRVLTENGWRREGRWLVGSITTGTFARIARTGGDSAVVR